MSYLIDTDVLSLLERKTVPLKLAKWIQENEPDIFISVVSLAEIQFGVDTAPLNARENLAAWLKTVRNDLEPATEPLSEPVLVRWKQLIAHLKATNRTMTCEDSLIAATALHHGHAIVTRNRRHFEPAGVRIIDPLA